MRKDNLPIPGKMHISLKALCPNPDSMSKCAHGILRVFGFEATVSNGEWFGSCYILIPASIYPLCYFVCYISY